MKIGIIGAISQEIKIIKKIINIYSQNTIGNFKIYIGKIRQNDIFLIKSGIGKVSASISTMIIINKYQPDIIINSGSAGSLISILKIGDVVIPKKICYYDVDLTNFGYCRGQVPKYPKQFTIHKYIYNFLKNILHKNQLYFTSGLIISGDSFVRGNTFIKKLKHNFSNPIAVEMESAAIAQVCYKFKIPLVIIKSISDLSDNDATLNFKENISIASFKSSKFIRVILENMINI